MVSLSTSCKWLKLTELNLFNNTLRTFALIVSAHPLFPLFQRRACKLAKLSACIAKCMTTIKTHAHAIHKGDDQLIQVTRLTFDCLLNA